MKKHLLSFLIIILTLGFASAQIVITEINYNSLGTDDTDYIELYNNSGADINMENYSFAQGFEYIFPAIVFPADSYMLLTVSSESLLDELGVEGLEWTSGSLGNNEDIQLMDPLGVEVDYVLYTNDGDGWPYFADNLGFALQLCDMNSDNALSSNWQVTNTKIKNSGGRGIYGTPGQPNNCLDGPLVVSSRITYHVIESTSTDTASFFFYLENSNGLPSSLSVSIDPSSTASPSDYDILSNEIFFDGAQNDTYIVQVVIIDDGLEEEKEKLVLNVSVEENVEKSPVDQVEIIFHDNDRALEKGLILVGVFDANDTDNFDNYGVELFAIKDIPDLSKYSVGFANNGGGSDGIEVPLPAISLNKGDNYFISDSKVRFVNFFGVESDLSDPASFITGDDAIELFEDGVVIDVYGEINVDGTDTSWEYANGWAKRIPDTGPDGTTFEFNNWLFSGVDFLVGPVNVACPLPYIFDFYMYTSTEDVILNSSFDITPNLVSHELMLDFQNGLNSQSSIIISNNQGNVVSKLDIEANKGSVVVDVVDLSAGMYYLTVQSKNGVQTKRFVKI